MASRGRPASPRNCRPSPRRFPRRMGSPQSTGGLPGFQCQRCGLAQRGSSPCHQTAEKIANGSTLKLLSTAGRWHSRPDGSTGRWLNRQMAQPSRWHSRQMAHPADVTADTGSEAELDERGGCPRSANRGSRIELGRFPRKAQPWLRSQPWQCRCPGGSRQRAHARRDRFRARGDHAATHWEASQVATVDHGAAIAKTCISRLSAAPLARIYHRSGSVAVRTAGRSTKQIRQPTTSTSRRRRQQQPDQQQLFHDVSRAQNLNKPQPLPQAAQLYGALEDEQTKHVVFFQQPSRTPNRSVDGENTDPSALPAVAVALILHSLPAAQAA
jgi:hypothetical protein